MNDHHAAVGDPQVAQLVLRRVLAAAVGTDIPAEATVNMEFTDPHPDPDIPGSETGAVALYANLPGGRAEEAHWNGRAGLVDFVRSLIDAGRDLP